MKVSVLGALTTVTGSKIHLESENANVLIDCGMYQGPKSLALKNKENLPLNYSNLDAIILTHAHLDHTGLLPLAVKHGFNGPVYGSSATLSLAKIILDDSSNLQKKDSKDGEVLYGEEEVNKVISLFTQVDEHGAVEIKDLKLSFYGAGHILGAYSILAECGEESILFSGDLGRDCDPIHRPPSTPPDCDTLYLESTYGDREHSNKSFSSQMIPLIKKAKEEKGVILIPSFAIARAQILLHEFSKLFKDEPSLEIPIFVNSPMINKATEVYMNFSELTKRSEEELKEDFSVAKFLHWSKETNKLKDRKGPHIIISASGMVSGGRVLEHLERLARFTNTTVCLTGFQSEESIGRRLLDGDKNIIVNGNKLNVRAKVVMLEGLSAHSDRLEILDWIKKSNKLPRKIVLVHGEESAKESFKEFLSNALGVVVEIAKKT